jgi:predicted permease
VAEHLRTVPGVETVSLAGVPLLSGYASNDGISINGAPPSDVLAYFLTVSPGWIDAMRIPLVAGRDFRASDTNPGVAIVSQTFAKQFLNNEDPVGKSFDRATDEGERRRFQIVGLVRDARYRDVHEPMLPVAYIPFQELDAKGAFKAIRRATFIVRTASSHPLALAAMLRQEVHRARSEFRVSNIRTQAELVQSQTIRERLLAMLALFFATVALLLAAIGLYGVLNYSVLQRQREIGIRMAIGAPAVDIARRVTADVFSMVLLGAVAGLLLALASVRYIESLLYQVKPTDPAMLAIPSLTILVAASLAALPAVIRAVRIDPAAMLRAD